MINVTRGSLIRVNCPSGTAERYPAFFQAFHGRTGKVLAIEPKGAEGVIQVDLSREGEGHVWINVDQSWLSHQH